MQTKKWHIFDGKLEKCIDELITSGFEIVTVVPILYIKDGDSQVLSRAYIIYK
jgi:hypothetical protein